MYCLCELFIIFVVICLHHNAFANESEKCDCEHFTFVQSPKINGRHYYISPNKHIFWWNKKEKSTFVHSYARGRFTSNMDVKDTFQCMSSFGKWTILWDGDGEVANCLAENMTCIAKKAEKGNTHFKGDCTVN